jgi:hypothetical protein
MNKKYLMIVSVLIASLLVMPVLAGVPKNKVTGEIWFTISGERPAYACFNGHDLGPEDGDKGQLTFEIQDGSGQYYIVDVKAVYVSEFESRIGGPVIDTNIGSVAGQWVLACLYDGGTPGTEGDQWWGHANTETNVVNWVDNGPPIYINLVPVTSGNLYNHYYDVA